LKKIHKNIGKYYTDKIKKYGATPQGVDWNSNQSIFIRFENLSKILDFKKTSVNDIGCGYGKFIEYLGNNINKIDYAGYDISKEMVNVASKLYPQNNFYYISHLNEIKSADFSIASGIFNVKLHFSNSEWEDYILNSLKIINLKSKKGFSFNMLENKLSKGFVKKRRLYYGSSSYYFDYCKKNFSENVTLINNYNLFDFTILVKK
jgi:SAM-dependent methyltransferase